MNSWTFGLEVAVGLEVAIGLEGAVGLKLDTRRLRWIQQQSLLVGQCLLEEDLMGKPLCNFVTAEVVTVVVSASLST